MYSLSPTHPPTPRPNTHICAFYNTDPELRAWFSPWLRQSLEINHKCLYIADTSTSETSPGARLQALVEGLELGPALARGQLVCQAASELYLSEGAFDLEAMLKRLRAEIEHAQTEGYGAVRLISEMTWALHGAPHSEKLMLYEARLNQALAGHAGVVLCLYDRRQFSAKALLTCLATHPTVAANTEMLDNFYFAPEEILQLPANEATLALKASTPAKAALAQFIRRDPQATILDSRLQRLTEHRQAEEKTRQLNAELEERVAMRTAELQQANTALLRASRLKDEFLANMSHELRTPLTAILGLTEALQTGGYGPQLPKQLQMLQIIHQSGQHLLDLIIDILDLSKIEAGRVELQLSPTAVTDICQTSLQFIKQAAHKKKIRVSFNSDPNVRLLQVDTRRLKQMLVNLLNNAVKFTPEGGQVALEVRGDLARQEVRFIVRDTGIGIPPEQQSQLFQPFVQVDGSLTRRYEGVGLGLALTRRLAEMHGGRVELESVGLNQGSCFTISLPWYPVEMPAPEPAHPAAHLINLTLPSGRSPTILLADDSPPTLITIGDYLQLQSASVITACNGDEALAQAQMAQPDLILMDIQMPDVDGLEVIRRLKAAPETRQTPIIAMTALAMQNDRELCLAAGADEYVTKPINLDQLTRLIHSQLKSAALRHTR